MVIGLFFLSDYFMDIYNFSEENMSMGLIHLEVTIPALINLIIILICDEIYDEISDKLTDFENHETVNDYEMNYIFKKYLLSFSSLCVPLLSI
jgi:hypothetical protein